MPHVAGGGGAAGGGGCVHFAFFRALVAVAALGYNQSAASHPALKGKSYQTGAAYREQ